MRYRNRRHAASALAHALARFDGKHVLVLGIPRGGLPMAAVIAEALHGDLDAVLVRKIGVPGYEEVALGAVDEAGNMFFPDEPARYGVQDPRPLAARELAVLAVRRAAYDAVHPSVDPQGRIVIIVDDGAATGATMVAALDSIRRRGAAWVVAAVPVASVHAADVVRAHADEVVVLAEPPDFAAVGEFYDEFDPVSDADVLAVLSRSKAEV